MQIPRLHIVLDLSAAQYTMFHPELISMDYVSMMSRTHKKPQYFFWNCGEQYFFGNWRGGGISPKNRSKSKNDEKQDRQNVFKRCSSFNISIDFKHILGAESDGADRFFKKCAKSAFLGPGWSKSGSNRGQPTKILIKKSDQWVQKICTWKFCHTRKSMVVSKFEFGNVLALFWGPWDQNGGQIEVKLQISHLIWSLGAKN